MRICRRLKEHRETNVYSTQQQQDFPIFSFGLDNWKVLWKIGQLGLVIFISYKAIFEWSLNYNIFMFMLMQVVIGLVLVIALFFLFDTLLTEKIILYRSKIVKIWRIGLKCEVWFVHARFGAIEAPICSTKIFYPYWISDFFTPILGVFYDETLVGAESARRMNQLLAEVSGRDISLFENGSRFRARSVSLRYFLKE